MMVVVRMIAMLTMMVVMRMIMVAVMTLLMSRLVGMSMPMTLRSFWAKKRRIDF